MDWEKSLQDACIAPKVRSYLTAAETGLATIVGDASLNQQAQVAAGREIFAAQFS